MEVPLRMLGSSHDYSSDGRSTERRERRANLIYPKAEGREDLQGKENRTPGNRRTVPTSGQPLATGTGNVAGLN